MSVDSDQVKYYLDNRELINKEICPFCFMGRVTKKGHKPSKLKDSFKDCPKCNGTGLIERK